MLIAGNTYNCYNAVPVRLAAKPLGGTFIGHGVSGSVFNPSLAALAGFSTDTIVYKYTTGKGGCAGYDTLIAKIYPQDTVSFSGFNVSASYCLTNAPNVTLIGNHNDSGTFSVVPPPPVGTLTGNVFSVSKAGYGEHDVIYSYTNPTTGCVTTDTTTVDVYSAGNIDFSGLDTVNGYCTNTSYVSLSGFPQGGTFSGPGVIGNSFSPSLAGSGQFTITYIYVNNSGCSGSRSHTVTVKQATTSTVSISGLDSVYCANSSAATLTGFPLGGTFSVPGAPNGTLTGNTFSPSVAGAGFYNVVYNYKDNNGCTYVDTLTAKVYALTPVSISGLNAAYCANALTDTLIGSPVGGSFSGSGINNTLFSPAIAGPGSAIITYTYTDTINSGISCTNTAKATTVVNALPTVSYTGLNSFYCIKTTAVSVLVGTPQGGSFFVDGVSSGPTFSPLSAGLGTHIVVYTYTNVNSCSNSFTDSTIIYKKPSVSVMGFDSVYCYYDSVLALTGVHPAVGGNAVFSGTGIVNDSAFNPVKAGLGAQSIMYAYTDSSGCSNDTTLSTIVTGLPNVSVSGLADTYCANAGAVNLSGHPKGGTFYGTDPGVFSDSTFYPYLTKTTGVYSIIYKFKDTTSGCYGSTKDSTTIIGRPLIGISDTTSEYCGLDANVYPLGGYPRGGILTVTVGSYSPSALDSGTFTPTLKVSSDSLEKGAIIYNYTDPVTTCSNADTFGITIYRVPVIDLYNSSICYSASATPFSVSAHPSGGTLTYSGTGVSGNAFNPSATGIGSFNITINYTTATGGCKTTQTDAIKVYKPNVNLVGLNSSAVYCANGPAVSIHADSTPGTYTYNPVTAFNDLGNGKTVFNPSIANPSNSLTYIYVDGNGCSDTVIQTLTVNPFPSKPVASAPDSICSNVSLDLMAVDTSSGVSYLWTLPSPPINKGPSISSPFIAAQNPVINPVNVITGWYSVKVINTYGCKSDSDSVHVIVKPVSLLPQPRASDTIVCDFNAVPVYIAAASDFNYYDWYLDNIRISGQHSDTLLLASIGTYIVKVSDNNGCTVNSQPITISGNSQLPVISAQGYPLVSSLTSTHASSYQWYVNGKRIIGETDSIIQVEYNGDYSVLAYYRSSCSDFSAGYTVDRSDFTTITRITSQTDSTITLPLSASLAASNIIIKYDVSSKNYYVEYTPVQDEELTITVTAMTGEILWQKEVSAHKGILSSTPVNVSNLASAMYILNAATSDQSQYRKIIVE